MNGTNFDDIVRRFRDVAPAADFWSLRVVAERDDHLAVRRGVVQPPRTGLDLGVMVTVCAHGGMGYAGTSDVTASGLARAVDEALAWARCSAGRSVVDPRQLARDPARGTYATPVAQPWEATSVRDKADLLREQCERLKCDDRIVDWSAALWRTTARTLFVSSTGSEIEQSFDVLLPMLSVTAAADGESQTRSLGDHAGRQGGLEVMAAIGFTTAAPRLAAEALELLSACLLYTSGARRRTRQRQRDLQREPADR